MRETVEYVPEFLGKGAADLGFTRLRHELQWIRHPDAPRSEYWVNVYNRSYTYGRGAGRRTYEPQPTHEVLERIGYELSQKFGVIYEGCFLNMYEDGRDSLGWHSDDDPGIDHSKPIAIVTLGEPRNIQFMPSWSPEREAAGLSSNDEKETVLLEHGSLCLMLPGMQQGWLHRIPKAGRVCGPRISLTFRGLLP